LTVASTLFPPGKLQWTVVFVFQDTSQRSLWITWAKLGVVRNAQLVDLSVSQGPPAVSTVQLGDLQLSRANPRARWAATQPHVVVKDVKDVAEDQSGPQIAW